MIKALLTILGMIPIMLMPSAGYSHLPENSVKAPLSAFTPNGYESTEEYPEEVNLVDRNSPIFSYTLGTSTIDVEETTFTFESGQIILPTYAHWDYTGDTPILSWVEYYVCNSSSQSLNAIGVAYAFSFEYLSGVGTYLYEYNNALIAPSITSVMPSVDSIDNTNGEHFGIAMALSYQLNGTGFSSTCTMSAPALLEALSPYAWNAVVSAKQAYAGGKVDGYENGYATGKDDGYSFGYSVGYSTAINDTGETGVMSGIFNSIIGVPIEVLNGLTPFVIWNTPIIYIVFTIILIGTLVFIIKRLIK